MESPIISVEVPQVQQVLCLLQAQQKHVTTESQLCSPVWTMTDNNGTITLNILWTPKSAANDCDFNLDQQALEQPSSAMLHKFSSSFAESVVPLRYTNTRKKKSPSTLKRDKFRRANWLLTRQAREKLNVNQPSSVRNDFIKKIPTTAKPRQVGTSKPDKVFVSDRLYPENHILPSQAVTLPGEIYSAQHDPANSFQFNQMEKIIKSSLIGGKLHFQVKWHGCKKTWEPKENVPDELIREYYIRKSRRNKRKK